MNSLVFGLSPTVMGEWRLWYLINTERMSHPASQSPPNYHEQVWHFLFRHVFITICSIQLNRIKISLQYFKEGCMVLWRGWYGTLKRVVWYFEEGGVVLWRGLYSRFLYSSSPGFAILLCIAMEARRLWQVMVRWKFLQVFLKNMQRWCYIHAFVFARCNWLGFLFPCQYILMCRCKLLNPIKNDIFVYSMMCVLWWWSIVSCESSKYLLFFRWNIFI